MQPKEPKCDRRMTADFLALRLLLATVAGWVNRRQQYVIDYLTRILSRLDGGEGPGTALRNHSPRSPCSSAAVTRRAARRRAPEPTLSSTWPGARSPSPARGSGLG